MLAMVAEITAIARTKGTVKLYFFAELISTLDTWVAEQAFGLDSNLYRIVYSVATLLILLVSARITWEARARWCLLTAALCASSGLWFTWHYAKSVDFWIVLSEGCLLLLVGTALGLRAPFEDNHQYVVLATIWLLMAVYDFHWLMNFRIPWIDAMAPSYLIIVACLYCSIFPFKAPRSLLAPPDDY